MRTVVFLLIVANLLFLAWAQGLLGSSSSPDAFRMQQQLLADQIRIVSRDDAPTEADTEKEVKAAEKKLEKVEEVCVQLNGLVVADSERFETLLSEKFSAFKAVRTKISGSTSYWVHIPPLASKKEAETKASELKKFGITDFFIMQEAGQNNLAISLGLFSSKESALAYLETLRGKGVKSAKLTERNVKPPLVMLEIRGPETQADALQQTVTEALPEVKPAACKLQAAPQ